MSEKKEKHGNRSSQYNRVLDDLVKRLDDSGVETWEFIQKQIDEAVATEQAAEEMTKDEASLLRAYLERDLSSLGYVMHETGASLAYWLNFDLDILEAEVLNRLVSIADHTRVDYELLKEHLDHGASQYMADEVTVAGTLSCIGCGTEQVLTDTAVIQPCEKCGARLFERKTATRAE